MAAVTYRFLVAREDIPGLPGLEKGDAVVRTAVEVMDGGYEYDVWRRLDDGMVAKTRIAHRDRLMSCEVDGASMAEVERKAIEVADGVRGGAGNE